MEIAHLAPLMMPSTSLPINIPSAPIVPAPIVPVNQDSGVSVSKISVDENAHFFATFIDGSSLRAGIEYCRLANTEGVFRFSKDKIVYEQGDADNTILNVIEIKTYELTEYTFVSKADEIVVGVNLSDLRNITRNVGKKDQLNMYILEGEPKSLYIQIKSQSEKGSESNLYLLPITSSSYTVYKLPEYQRKKKDPTVTIYQSDFSKLCKSLVTIKCSYVTVHGFKNGIIMKGILNTGAIGSVKEFGKCNNTSNQVNLKSINNDTSGNIVRSKVAPPKLNIGEANEIERFKIDINIIKYLVKLNAMSATGTLKVYIERGLPMKIQLSVGSFGRCTVYING